MSLILMKEAWG